MVKKSQMIFLFNIVTAYPHYQRHIPNGHRITNWPAVGHVNWYGGHLNPFGIDFKSTNYTWSIELCQLDSNKNGLTNGQELGDPYCTWRPGSIPFTDQNITNPGLVVANESSKIPIWIITHVFCACMGLILLLVIGYMKPKGHRVIMQTSLVTLTCSMLFVKWNFNNPHGILGFLLVMIMLAQINYKASLSPIVHKWIGKYIFMIAWSQFLLGYAKLSEIYGDVYANTVFIVFSTSCIILTIYMRIST